MFGTPFMESLHNDRKTMKQSFSNTCENCTCGPRVIVPELDMARVSTEITDAGAEVAVSGWLTQLSGFYSHTHIHIQIQS